MCATVAKAYCQTVRKSMPAYDCIRTYLTMTVCKDIPNYTGIGVLSTHEPQRRTDGPVNHPRGVHLERQ